MNHFRAYVQPNLIILESVNYVWWMDKYFPRMVVFYMRLPRLCEITERLSKDMAPKNCALTSVENPGVEMMDPVSMFEVDGDI